MERRGAIGVYVSRKMAVLLALGFASGLPLGMTGATLRAWLTDAGLNVRTIGFLTLVTLPYTLKFVWSPVMDRFVPPGLGRRRGWLLITQVACAAAMLAMAAAGPEDLTLLAAAAAALAFCSASQDIVADAYRTDVLDDAERGAGAAVFVTGYRAALLVATGAMLVVQGRYGWSWPAVYAATAALLAVGVAATLAAPEPAGNGDRPASLGEAVVAPVRQFVARRGWWVVLLFIVLFKLPDVLLETMKITYLKRVLDFSNEEIGRIAQSLGLLMSIFGALAGGSLVARLGLYRSLWLFAVLQAVSNLGFLLLLPAGRDEGALAAVIAVENTCGGLVAAGFIAFLMAQCDRRFSATQYALLSSLMAMTLTFVGAPAGVLTAGVGWADFIALSVFAIVPAICLLPWVRPSIDTASPGDVAASAPPA